MMALTRHRVLLSIRRVLVKGRMEPDESTVIATINEWRDH